MEKKKEYAFEEVCLAELPCSRDLVAQMQLAMMYFINMGLYESAQGRIVFQSRSKCIHALVNSVR